MCSGDSVLVWETPNFSGIRKNKEKSALLCNFSNISKIWALREDPQESFNNGGFGFGGDADFGIFQFVCGGGIPPPLENPDIY